MVVVMISPQEETLRRLTMMKALTRKNIDNTRDLKKREMYRKKYEKISKDLNDLLRKMKMDVT